MNSTLHPSSKAALKALHNDIHSHLAEKPEHALEGFAAPNLPTEDQMTDPESYMNWCRQQESELLAPLAQRRRSAKSQSEATATPQGELDSAATAQPASPNTDTPRQQHRHDEAAILQPEQAQDHQGIQPAASQRQELPPAAPAGHSKSSDSSADSAASA